MRCANVAGAERERPAYRVSIAEQLDDGVRARKERNIDLGTGQPGLLRNQLAIEMTSYDLLQAQVAAVPIDRAIEVSDSNSDMV
jgi:hypothetical protein